MKLLDEKENTYKNNVFFNLVKGKDGFKSGFFENKQTSDNVFFANFFSGALDLDDMDKLSNALYSVFLSHEIAERTAVSNNNYEKYLASVNTLKLSTVDGIEKDQMLKEYDNSHLAGIIQESLALNEFLMYRNGKKPVVQMREEVYKDFEETIKDILKTDNQNEQETRLKYGNQVDIIIKNDRKKTGVVTSVEAKIKNPDIISKNGALDK